jgi:hypothetical protein
MPNPPDVAQGSTSTHQGDGPKARPGYLIAIIGAIVGGYVVANAYGIVVMATGLFGLDASLYIYGHYAALMVGMGLGMAGLLAAFRKKSPVFTAIVSIPITIVFLLLVWGVSFILDNYIVSLNIHLFAPFIVPFVSRWAALAIRRGR